MVFVSFSLILFNFCWFFKGVSMDFCKGRIPPNTLQILLEAPQILPLWIVSGLTPDVRYKQRSHQSLKDSPENKVLGFLKASKKWDLQSFDFSLFSGQFEC